MRFDRKRLAPAIHLNYASTDRFKTDSLTIYFILPLEKDTLSAYSLLPEVLRTACMTAKTPKAMAKRLQELYDTSVSVCQYHMGERKILAFSADMLSPSRLPNGEGLLKGVSAFFEDMLCHPYLVDGYFSSAYTAQKKTALADAVRALKNRKSSYALMRCRALMLRGTNAESLPYGKVEDILGVTPEGLLAAYGDLFSRGQIECYFEGSAPEKDVTEALSFLVNAVKATYCQDALAVTPYRPQQKILRTEESISARQGRLVLGFDYPLVTSVREEAAFALMMEILAYSPVSRLFMQVREAEGLCYSCTASNDFFRGQLFIVAGIDNENAGRTEAAILAQVKELQAKAFDETEFLAAKTSLRSTILGLLDAPDSFELRAFRRRLAGFSDNDEDTVEAQLAAIDAVTPFDVAAVSKLLALRIVYFLRADGGGEEDETDD